MGCEAFISVARVQDGHHLLDADADPVFTVKGPVAILPVYAMGLDRGLTHYTTHMRDIDDFLTSEFFDGQLVPFAGGVILVLPRDHFVIKYRLVEWGNQVEGPGCEPMAMLLEAWDKIMPGIWCVTGYYESGTGSDASHFFRRNGVVFGPEVKWEIWT